MLLISVPGLSAPINYVEPKFLKERDGAGDEIRTRDIDLGKVALYQLSYSRKLRRL